MRTAAGHVDFFVNGGDKQPHCYKVYRSATQDSCAHRAALFYFYDSLQRNETTKKRLVSKACALNDDLTKIRFLDDRQGNQLGIDAFPNNVTQYPNIQCLTYESECARHFELNAITPSRKVLLNSNSIQAIVLSGGVMLFLLTIICIYNFVSSRRRRKAKTASDSNTLHTQTSRVTINSNSNRATNFRV